MNIAIITSRWESKRLPGKALIDICGKPLLRHIVDEARKSQYLDDVVVATTPSSYPIIEYCKEELISFSVGDEEDILSRLFRAATAFNATKVIRLWGDNPILDYKRIDDLIESYEWTEPDYYFMSDMPMSIISYELLSRLHRELTDFDDRHWFHRHIMESTYLTVQTDKGFDNISVDDEESLNEARKRICG